jgi:hypothetical protein
VVIKNSYEKWSGGSEGEMKRRQPVAGVIDRGQSYHKGGYVGKGGGHVEEGEYVIPKGGSLGKGENRGREQPDRVRPNKQTMPETAQQAKRGEYPWDVEGHSHNEVHDRQPSDGVNRQILEGQNFDQKELATGGRDLAYSEKHLMASKRGAMPKGQK